MGQDRTAHGAEHRERLRALFGEPLREDLAMRPVMALMERRAAEAEARRSARKERDRLVASLISRLAGGIEREELERLRDIQVTARREARSRPARLHIEPGVHLGSLEFIFVPPYDYQWTYTPNGVNVGFGEWSWKSDHVKLAYAVADKGAGDVHVRSRVCMQDVNWSGAGLGMFYRPLTAGWKRFRFGASWSYDWVDDSTFLTANNDGYFGLLVGEYDRNGENPQLIVNQRFPQWTDGTGWLEHHEDSDSGAVGGFESMPFLASPERVYALQTMCWVEVQSDDETGGDLLPVASYAEGEIELHVPAMSIKEA